MSMMALIRKEILEQWRTRRFLVLAVVFVFFGLLGPITAKLTPEILKLVGTSAPGVIIEMPPPAVQDAVAQYLKNLSQLLPLAVLLVAMGSVVGEKEKGTLPMVLAKPVSRGTVLGAKLLALTLTVIVSLFLGAVAAYYYSQLLFNGPGAGAFLLLNLVAGLYLLVVLCLTLWASTLARSTVVSAALALGLWLGLSLLSALPRVGRFFPPALLGWAGRLGMGQGGRGEWPALGTSLLLIAGVLLWSWLHFRREEL